MKKRLVHSLCVFSLSILSAPCFAFPDLVQAFNDAYQYDPVFQSAISSYQAASEELPQARAALLPNLNLTANTYLNNQNNQSPSIPRVLRGNISYNSYEYTVTLTQPLLNVANWTQFASSIDTARQSLALTVAAYQDLIIRVVTAYVKVLQAEDTLSYTQAQKRAVGKQLEHAKARFNVGLEAITAVYEAQASYDAITAQEIGNKVAVINALEDLRHVTGKRYCDIAKIKQELPLLNPKPACEKAWVDAAAAQNFTLQGARFAADAARTAIKTAFAGHLPTINAVATHDHTRSGADSLAIGIDTTTDSVGLQLNMPIYQGGLVVSKTREAMWNYNKLRADMETAYLDATVKARQNYNNVVAGIQRIKADRNAILSARGTVEATEIALKVGTRTMVDLLKAESDLFRVQQTMSIDIYEYIIATLTLKEQVGTLGARDIMAINSWLRGQQCGPIMTPYNYHPVPPSKALPLRLPRTTSKEAMALINESEVKDVPELPLPVSEVETAKKLKALTPSAPPTAPPLISPMSTTPSFTPMLPRQPTTIESVVPPPSTRGLGGGRMLAPSSGLPKTSGSTTNPSSNK